MGRALPKRVVGWSGGLHAQESSTIIRILFSPKQSHRHHQLHWSSQETLISELKHQVCKAKLKKRSKTGPPPSSSWPEQRERFPFGPNTKSLGDTTTLEFLMRLLPEAYLLHRSLTKDARPKMLPTRTQQTFTNSRTRLFQGKESVVPDFHLFVPCGS